MTTKSKGDYHEEKLKQQLEAAGWLVEKAIHLRNHQDLFGVADLVCISPSANYVRFIGVTSIGHKLRSVNKLIALKTAPCILKEVYCYVGRGKPWREFRVEGDKYWEVTKQ